MKTRIFLFFSLILSFQVFSQAPVLTESFGWLENLSVKWQPVAGADSYNVYYTGNGQVDKKIDTQLIRSYGAYFRADIPGLKAGAYTVKVVPVASGVEGSPSVTNVLDVLAHDRSGFSFANGRVPGAYKADGTPKDNAVVIYVAEKNKNTISMTVTGANSNPCVGLQAILDGFKKGKDNRPLIVRMVGQITDLTYMLGGDIVIENNNNASGFITVEGVGDDAVADGWGLRIKNASNIEVRNIGFMNCNSGEGDNVGLQQKNDYIWVHNCDMFYGNAGSDADQIKGDGALDCKGSTYVTFSYNHFWDSGKSNLLGLSEGKTTGLYISYHHNWYDHSDSRHPRVRYFSAHVYNNYYDGIAKYGVGSTLGSSVFVEGNYFRNCKRPMMISMQGTDVWSDTKQANDYANVPTFSNEDGGIIKAFNNSFDYPGAQPRFVAYGDPNAAYNISGKISSTIDFDAYVVENRGDQVPANVKSVYGANTYNNFDTDASLYVKNQLVDQPAVAKDKVTQFAGRVSGGDLKWTFNNSADDAAYTVNVGLKAAVTGYKTKLVAVQGEGASSSSSQTLTSSGNENQTVAAGVAIEQIVFTWGGDATDVTVSGLPASGIVFVKNSAAKTISISGTPSANVAYSITTLGATGTPATASGAIVVSDSDVDDDEGMIHNFTVSGKNSSFYTITGNLSTGKGTVVYDDLTLTQCLKIESTTNISFTSSKEGVLTLVLIEPLKKIKIDEVPYTSNESGIVTVTLAAGSHTIKKSDTMNLFYMKLVYNNVPTQLENQVINDIKLYPNPVKDRLNIESNDELIKIEVFTLTGQKLTQTSDDTSSIDLSFLAAGNYILKVQTSKGVISKLIVKN